MKTKILSFSEYRISNAIWIQSQITHRIYSDTLFVQIAMMYLGYLIICGISQKEKEDIKDEIQWSEFYLNQKFNDYSDVVELHVYEYFELLFKHKSSIQAKDMIEKKYKK